MVTKIKEYLYAGWAVLTAFAVAAFFYERNLAQVNEALVDESKLNTQLVQQNGQIATNDVLLHTEEEKRAALEKEVNSNANITDITKYFNSKS